MEYLVGAAFMLASYGSIFLATEIAVRRLLPSHRGAVRIVSWAVLAAALALVIHTVLGMAGLLSREPVLFASAVFATAIYRFVPTRQAPPEAQPPTPSRAGTRVESWLMLAGAIAACLWLAVAVAHYLTLAPIGFDSTSAYLPTAARWLQQGSIWGIQDWVPYLFYGSGPGNGSLLVASTMLPWENDFAVRLAVVPFIPLTTAALFALGRELGGRDPSSLLVALAATAVPVAIEPGLVNALLDPLMYFGFAAGLLFLVRHWRTQDPFDLAVASVGLGISFGTKFYAYTSVAIVALMWFGLLAAKRRGLRRALAQGALLAGTIVALGGAWMLRNLLDTGNPLTPLGFELLGLESSADPQRPVFGASLASYLDQPSVWVETLADQFRHAAAAPALLAAILVAWAAALAIARARRGSLSRSDGAAIAGLLIVGLLVIMYVITPYTGLGPPGEPTFAAINVRYGVPAVLAAAALAGYVSANSSSGANILICVLALVAMVDGLRESEVIGTGWTILSIVAGLAIGAATVARGAGVDAPRVRALLPNRVGAALAATSVLVVGGYFVQRSYNENRYRSQDEVLRAVAEQDGQVEIGLAGFWFPEDVVPTYPAFGERLSNDVDYLGRVERALLLPHANGEAFREALTRDDPDLLVIGLAEPPSLPSTPTGLSGRALNDIAAAVGYERLAGSKHFVLLGKPPI
jgi:hypothetical protein